MARLVKTVSNQFITCDIITVFEDGTTSVKTLAEGDIVEGLRYVENNTVKTITGKIVSINKKCSKVTPVSVNYPADNFSTDVVAETIRIDASEQYASNVVDVVAREIVEDEGVENVVKVDVTTVPRVTFTMTYTDGKVVDQDVVVGDVLCDMIIMTAPGRSDITGDFRVAGFMYAIANSQLKITGLYLASLTGGKNVGASFEDIISFTEKPSLDVTSSSSLSQIAKALANEDEVFAFLSGDVTIPAREDGKISTLMVNAGKSLTVDLAGHSLNTPAYAFYVNGGELTIRDSGSDDSQGKITASLLNKAYPAVFVNSDGVCTMESGVIDTSEVEVPEGSNNWLYGVACSGNGIFNMTGGQLITGSAAGISITNGTASGEGAQFNISGDAVITSKDGTAIYLADNKEVNISDKAVINGGILLRLGDVNVSGNAVVNGHSASDNIYPLGQLVCISGCSSHNAAILALTGCYNSTLGNDLNINISDSAKVKGYIDNGIDIATLNTKYDQLANVNIAASSNIIAPVDKWNVYNHDELAAMATECGKTLVAEKTTTDLTIKVEGSKVYPKDVA